MSALPQALEYDEETIARVARPVLTDFVHALDPVQMFLANGKRPERWQAQAVREQMRNLILLCSRQSGKTEVVVCRTGHRSLYRAPWFTLVLSATERQATEVVKRLRAFVAPYEDRFPLVTDAKSQIEWANGSRVISLPATPATVRGYASANEIILDESQDIASELYRTIRPIVAVSRGRFSVLGTAKWEQGWFWEEFTRAGAHDQDAALSLSDDWRRFMVDATQCPRFTPEFLADEKRTMGEDFFNAEYMCRFRKAVRDPGEAPFAPNVVEQTFSRPTTKAPLFGGRRPS